MQFLPSVPQGDPLERPCTLLGKKANLEAVPFSSVSGYLGSRVSSEVRCCFGLRKQHLLYPFPFLWLVPRICYLLLILSQPYGVMMQATGLPAKGSYTKLSATNKL